MGHGGKRAGAGGPKGRASKKRARVLKIAADYVRTGKITPLEIILSVMEQSWINKDIPAAMSAAEKAAPYIHPKLASTELKGDPQKPLLPPDIYISFSKNPHKPQLIDAIAAAATTETDTEETS